MKLLDQYRELHKQGAFPGFSIRNFADDINALMKECNATSALDYGCGHGIQYLVNPIHRSWGFLPHLYDPASDYFCKRPKDEFDVVICTDVAEHVPEDEVSEFCKDVCGFARHAVFVSVCCRPSKRLLPDGNNCHITLQTMRWWEARFRKHLKPDCKLVMRENL